MSKPSSTDIPIGRENAITRDGLRKLWNCPDREARRIIARLRAEDDGSGYIIVSHSSGRGYYRTNNYDEIKHYVLEQSKRARNTFKPLKAARRVLKELERRAAGGSGC